jgi:hypothetical protein
LGESSLTLSEPPSTQGLPRRAYLADFSDRSFDLDFDAENFQNITGLDVTNDDVPSLSFFDKKKEKRINLGLGKDSKPLLALWGEGQKEYTAAYLTDDGISLVDPHQHTRAVLGSTRLENTKTGSTEETGPSSVTLFDKNGKLLWRAPLE